MRLAPLAVLLLASIAAAADPVAKPAGASAAKVATVLCTLRSPRGDGTMRVVFDGPCRFLPDGKGGSFSISALDGESPLFGEITDVSVTVVAPGKAEVRSSTADGIGSRWGEALRSKQDPACWTGADFEVCARRKP